MFEITQASCLSQVNKAERDGRCVCISMVYPLSAGNEDELSFKAGDLIMLKARVSGGWLRGQLMDGGEGIFPKNYVEVVVSELDMYSLGLVLSFVVRELLKECANNFKHTYSQFSSLWKQLKYFVNVNTCNSKPWTGEQRAWFSSVIALTGSQSIV